jgi:hypothetical protein
VVLGWHWSLALVLALVLVAGAALSHPPRPLGGRDGARWAGLTWLLGGEESPQRWYKSAEGTGTGIPSEARRSKGLHIFAPKLRPPPGARTATEETPIAAAPEALARLRRDLARSDDYNNPVVERFPPPPVHHSGPVRGPVWLHVWVNVKGHRAVKLERQGPT